MNNCYSTEWGCPRLLVRNKVQVWTSVIMATLLTFFLMAGIEVNREVIVTANEQTGTELKQEVIIPANKQTSPEDLAPSKGSNILIVAFRRTGSTFLGRLLGARDDTFYWHEPMRFLRWNHYWRGEDLLCDYYKPTCTIQSDKDSVTRKDYLRITKEIFSCNFTSLANEDDLFLNMELNKHSPLWNSFRACTKHRHFLDCVATLQSACKTAKHHVIKVVRTDLEGILNLYDSVPDLKIVQLLRDVRGTINSRLRIIWYSKSYLNTLGKIEDETRVLCSMVRRTIPIAQQLLAQNKEHFKVLQYEDLTNLNHKLCEFFQWLGQDCSNEHMAQSSSQLLNPEHTLKDEADEGNHPELYRTQMEWKTVQMIDKHCADIHAELGFKTFNSEQEFRDVSINTHISDSLPYHL